MSVNRRTFLRASGFSAMPAAWPGGARAAAAKPNILIITTDQPFGDAMSCRPGKQYLRTPAMDSLAAQGALFSRASSWWCATGWPRAMKKIRFRTAAWCAASATSNVSTAKENGGSPWSIWRQTLGRW